MGVFRDVQPLCAAIPGLPRASAPYITGGPTPVANTRTTGLRN